MRRVTANDVMSMKAKGDKIPVITAYDYPMALLADKAGFPIILVGDSLGMVSLGYDSTIPVTMDDMTRHTRAAARGATRSLLVTDMPFMSFQLGNEDALRNAGRLVQEGGAQSVKLEGGGAVVDSVRRIVEAGIPVMGHLGLTPQSVHRFGGYKVQGKARKEAFQLLEDARALEDAGAYAVVLELLPAPLSRIITEKLTIPTIGIGAGPHCDGQVQVLHDLLGLIEDFVPKHARRYVDLASSMKTAVSEYMSDVTSQSFPSHAESHHMEQDALEQLTATLSVS
jgi:3-methyl-2-oxobutanoate hydroxymethyltransferase